MGQPISLVQAIQDLVRELVNGNFAQLERDGRAGRLTASEIENAIKDYGRTLVELPSDILDSLNMYPNSQQRDVIAVDVDLWTAEEGRSDLTLSLTAQNTPNGIILLIDDLHVL